MSRKLYKTLGEFKAYIFMLKILLYLLIIFGNIRIDTLHEENGSPQENTPRKLSPRKFPPGIFPPISLIAFLQLTVRLDKFSRT